MKRSSGDQAGEQADQVQCKSARDSGARLTAMEPVYLECFAKLHTVLSLPELECAITDILGELLPCRDVRFHYNDDSAMVKAAGVTSYGCRFAQSFANGFLKSLTSSRDVSHLDGSAVQQAEAVSIFGQAPNGHQGVALPIRECGATATTHCLVTLVAAEVTDQQRMTLEAFKRQLETTCTRLVRLASLGFPSSTGAGAGGGGGGKTPSGGSTAAQAGSNGPEDSSVGERSVTALERRDSRPHPILALCAELYDQDSGNLQLKVINYLKSRISCETGFLLLVSQDRAHVFCQVVGNAILAEEVHIGVCIGHSHQHLTANKGVKTRNDLSIRKPTHTQII